jgi:Ca-activated chloride channel homolog
MNSILTKGKDMRFRPQPNRWPVAALCISAICLLYAGCANEAETTSDSPVAARHNVEKTAEPTAMESPDMSWLSGAASGDDSIRDQDEPQSSAAPTAQGFTESASASVRLPSPEAPATPGDTDESETVSRAVADNSPSPGPSPIAGAREESDKSDESKSGGNQSGADNNNFDRGQQAGGFGGGGGGLGGVPGGQGRARLSKQTESVPLAETARGATKRLSQLSQTSPADREADKHVVAIDLQPGEELWVIAKAATNDIAATAAPERPGCGALMAKRPGVSEMVPVPLKHTSVVAGIDGYIATVDVTQQFHNPFDSKIEAVYVFPLPQNAAVNEFVMTVGERKIRGIIREREKAVQIYNAARAQGHVASLLTQERPNIFTQKVANIESGKRIDIQLRYFNTLQYDDGAYEFVFPMVVGPRFNPPHITDGIGAVPRGTGSASGQQTDVAYLAPRERSGHDVSITLDVDAGVSLENINSVNHAIDVKTICESQKRITLTDADTIPNRDFVVRYHVAGDQIKTALMTHQDDYGNYFTMMLYPPKDLETVQRSPMEMVFVLDCSGSMKGRPIEQAKQAIAHSLQSLTPRDTFQIIRFSSNASQLGTDPVVATPANIQRGLNYLASLSGTGGTHMVEGIKSALGFTHDEGRFRVVSFMTDGYIGNEQEILYTMSHLLGPSRVFSFGVGQSPNRFLMDRMAGMGRGAVAYLSLNDNAQDVMDHFNRRISHPAMTDLSINWGAMEVTDVYPQRMPDLIVGRPVIVTGRFKGEPGVVSVGGRIGMQPASFVVAVDEDDANEQHNGIAAVWARLKIKELMAQVTAHPDSATELHHLVTQTALNHNLMSSFTAFVAVDSMTRTGGDYGTTVAVPVPTPEGVRYDTTVGGDGSN